MICTQKTFHSYEWLSQMMDDGLETASRPEESTKFTPSSMERLFATLKLLEGIEHGDTVLDLGCGKGLLLHALRAFGPDITYIGVDHERENVDYLNEMDNKKIIGIKADLLDGIPRIGHNGRIDYVTCIGVFGIGDLWDNASAFGLLDIMWEKAEKGVVASFLREDKDESYGDNTFDPLKVYCKLMSYSKRASIFQPHVPHFVVGAAYKFDTIWMEEWKARGGKR